jgi:predicted NAD-dependent protein-ADP-ribosyltransferase YbiA (DUF1768 family)
MSQMECIRELSIALIRLTQESSLDEKLKDDTKVFLEYLLYQVENAEQTPIKFYEKSAPYYEFSNFYISPFIDDEGKKWTTVENYFQAKKFRNPEYREYIRQADTANKAFALGRMKKLGGYLSKNLVNSKTCKETVNSVIDKFMSLGLKPIENWEEERLDVMEVALYYKFSQNKKLRDLLTSTENRPIIEDSPRDSFWGIGADGKGENHLGRLLEKTRSNMIKYDKIKTELTNWLYPTIENLILENPINPETGYPWFDIDQATLKQARKVIKNNREMIDQGIEDILYNTIIDEETDFNLDEDTKNELLNEFVTEMNI